MALWLNKEERNFVITLKSDPKNERKYEQDYKGH